MADAVMDTLAEQSEWLTSCAEAAGVEREDVAAWIADARVEVERLRAAILLAATDADDLRAGTIREAVDVIGVAEPVAHSAWTKAWPGLAVVRREAARLTQSGGA